jgi:hypothetical protein
LGDFAHDKPAVGRLAARMDREMGPYGYGPAFYTTPADGAKPAGK